MQQSPIGWHHLIVDTDTNHNRTEGGFCKMEKQLCTDNNATDRCAHAMIKQMLWTVVHCQYST